MAPKVLITGGAGFIGTHLARELLRRGCDVTVLDNFNPQIHGSAQTLPPDLASAARLVRGDVRDEAVWLSALPQQDCVVHLAAETGTGQSMYSTTHYEQVNIGGTALLCDLLAQPAGSSVQRLVIASSRAIYGEGAYLCAQHGIVYPAPQTAAAKSAGCFDPVCPHCSSTCTPTATPETAPLHPTSFYGTTKQSQEEIALRFATAHGLPAIALRYQNVYGPGQSLHNPYTGILAIFSNLARAGQPLEVFEDGQESRDFVFVIDAVLATADSVTDTLQAQRALNIGSGARTSLLELATAINAFHGSKSTVRVSGRFRDGDIRHALADLTQAHRLLTYEPATTLTDGLHRFLTWAAESAPQDESAAAAHTRSLDELRKHGLLHG
ncbi:MAG: NAD-dependent epimerase/dehydratase family protein [Acidobacteriaceae bacterium]|nr:NAD-dependent epimerase/dehydratase family protein [Acidobacteriaceae bacterium]